MSRRGYWAIGALLAVTVSGAALAALIARGGALTSNGIALYEVRRAKFVRRATADGVLKAAKATPITVPAREGTDAYKILWIADDGTRVRAGDVVVQFDPTELERALVDGRDERSSAESKAEKVKALAGAGAGNLTDQAQLARREREHAESFANEDTKIFSRNEIIESQIDRDLATKKTDHTQWKIGASAKQSDLEEQKYRIQESAALRDIRRAQDALTALTIRAPYDGLLLLDRNQRGESARVGDSVWAGQKVAEIPELADMEARVFVLEADASGLAPGRAVEVTLSSRPDITFPGVVGRVDALAKPVRRNVPVNYFETVVTLRPPAGLALKPGTRVRCRIDLEAVDGALVVPRQAVFEKDGRPIVYRAEGDKFVPVGVKVGRYGLGTAMIEEGIREGERVALRDPAVAASEIFEKTGADQASGPRP